jgi:hypothetical protein
MWVMRERIRQSPLPAVFAYYAITFGALSLILDTLFGVWGGPGWAALAGVLFAAIMTPVTSWQRKRDKRA